MYRRPAETLRRPDRQDRLGRGSGLKLGLMSVFFGGKMRHEVRILAFLDFKRGGRGGDAISVSTPVRPREVGQLSAFIFFEI